MGEDDDEERLSFEARAIADALEWGFITDPVKQGRAMARLRQLERTLGRYF